MRYRAFCTALIALVEAMGSACKMIEAGARDLSASARTRLRKDDWLMVEPA